MNRLFVLLLVVLSGPGMVRAQDDGLFGPPEKTAPTQGIIFGVNGNFDVPGGDMSDRFGLSYRIGPSIQYKTANDWIFGIKADFIFGNDIKEDSFLTNLRDSKGAFLDMNGRRVGLGIYERGYLVGLQGGKVLHPFKKKSNGILLLTSAGFIQHKITMFNGDYSIPQVSGDYRKGYDRLSNGWFLEQCVAFNHFSTNSIVHYYLGLDVMAGFTQGRRDYLYDVMRPDKGSRVDLLFGIRGGWYIPIFKRKSEEYFFE